MAGPGGQVQYPYLSGGRISALGARRERVWEWARDDCKYFSSMLFIENVQMCECEINVLNSPGAPGFHALNDASSQPVPEED